jgi:hypothetical protein
MKVLRILFSIAIISTVSNCKKNNVIEEDQEKNIFYQLIPELIDNSCLLPPPPPIFLSEKNVLKRKKLEMEYQNFADSLKNSVKVIALFDTILNIDKEEFNEIKLENKFEINNAEFYDNKITLNLDSITLKENIILKDRSQIKEIRKLIVQGKEWNEIPALKDSKCSMSFSRIVLNKDRDKGFFRFAVGCGKLCGSGFDVWITKVNGKWIIEKQKSTWVS